MKPTNNNIEGGGDVGSEKLTETSFRQELSPFYFCCFAFLMSLQKKLIKLSSISNLEKESRPHNWNNEVVYKSAQDYVLSQYIRSEFTIQALLAFY